MRHFPSWVRPYIGLPYKPLGRERDGIDCWGLFRLINKEVFGIELASWEGVGYEAGKDSAEVERILLENAKASWEQIPYGQEKVGDGLLLRIIGRPLHIGLVVAPGWMIHIESKGNSCLEQFNTIRWERRVLGVYRYAAIA